jgi:hypothetical protein
MCVDAAGNIERPVDARVKVDSSGRGNQKGPYVFHGQFHTGLSTLRPINFEWTNVGQCYTLLSMQKKLTAVRLKPGQLQRLREIAVREDLPISWLIRKAIDEFLKRKK